MTKIPIDVMDNIGSAIKERREKQCVSQTALARKAGINRSYLWKIETGISQPSWETACALLVALGYRIRLRKDR